MSSSNESKALHQAVEELTAAREAARLKLHLLSMDAKKSWDDLEHKFQELQTTVGERGEKVTEASAAMARDLAHSIRKFVERVV